MSVEILALERVSERQVIHRKITTHKESGEEDKYKAAREKHDVAESDDDKIVINGVFEMLTTKRHKATSR